MDLTASAGLWPRDFRSACTDSYSEVSPGQDPSHRSWHSSQWWSPALHTQRKEPWRICTVGMSLRLRCLPSLASSCCTISSASKQKLHMSSMFWEVQEYIQIYNLGKIIEVFRAQLPSWGSHSSYMVVPRVDAATQISWLPLLNVKATTSNEEIQGREGVTVCILESSVPE